MNKVIYYGFLIKVSQLMETGKTDFVVADLVGSGRWIYPFSIIYDTYYQQSKSDFVNWNTARTNAGRMFSSIYKEIAKELGVEISQSVAKRKGHNVTCYYIGNQS